MTAAFWVASLAIIGCYAFFVTLGAWDPAEVVGLTLAVLFLAGLWLGRTLMGARRPTDGRDPRLIQQRERRGF